MKKAIIFDLDGTLLNSLIDISESVNYVLEKYNFKTHSFEDYKYMIGNGIAVLIEKALPTNLSKTDAEIYFNEIKLVYEKRQTIKSKPYNGIIEMLKTLENKGISLNILSNKPNNFTQEVVNHFFADIKFDFVFGEREGYQRKPSPQTANEIIEKLGFKKSEFLYMGDTSTDMLTAKAANIDAIGVTWGYRKVDELLENGAKFIINNPKEILDLLMPKADM
jgi:phosphoglycolate phosphatase